MLALTRRAAALAALAPLAAALPLGAAAQSHKALAALLVDVPQWKGGKADGMSVQMQGQDMTWATREYKRGDAEITAILGIGHPMGAQVQMMGLAGGGAAPEPVTVKGFPVFSMYDKADRAGIVIVSLTSGNPFNTQAAAAPTLMIQFTRVGPDEALSFAERFDLAAMRDATRK
ncbi:MAG: hypothetical protein IPK81_07365 [Rhodospirillales bacterium]|nr:hypothetical protein [Rhodospirillales bacterium]QQS13997.1 MAG: hypothetical protein IPK81_07365 [Rhodospirillales bacterium]